MKTHIYHLGAAFCAATLLPAARAADPKPAPAAEKRELRVLSAPEHDRRVIMNFDRAQGEKETVAFLGVEASPVSAALSAQLSLQRGTGLAVNHVVAKSPAAGVLKEHDILLKLDDQILIETRQLSVLIRGHKEGDEVTVTYLRAGQKATAAIKLGTQEVPKFSWTAGANVRALAGLTGVQDGTFELLTPGPDGEREHLDRVLSLIGRARGAPDAPPGAIPPPVRIQIDHGNGPGIRAMSINTGNSNIVFSDDEGALELTMADGVKSLVAKNAKGEPVFSGPVTTPEERKAVPAEVRARLEKLEGMRDVTFRTDGDFKGAETRVVRPRGIGLPMPAPRPAPAPPIFY
ncbi:MAG: PDZ domain-containing protein [Opitutaceae bacterium]